MCANVNFLKNNACKPLFLFHIELLSRKIQTEYQIKKRKHRSPVPEQLDTNCTSRALIRIDNLAWGRYLNLVFSSYQLEILTAADR